MFSCFQYALEKAAAMRQRLYKSLIQTNEGCKIHSRYRTKRQHPLPDFPCHFDAENQIGFFFALMEAIGNCEYIKSFDMVDIVYKTFIEVLEL